MLYPVKLPNKVRLTLAVMFCLFIFVMIRSVA